MFRRTTISITILCWFAFPLPVQAGDKQPQANIARWIKELGHSDYPIRVKAQQKLVATGVEAIPNLERASRGESPEIRKGASSILQTLFNSADEKLVSVAESAIRNTHSDSEFERITCKRAMRILERHKPKYEYDDNKTVVKIALGDTTKRLTPSDFRELRYFQSLQSLDLSTTNTTNSDLKYLSTLRNLVALRLRSTNVTDDGLVYLKGLSSLQEILLTNTKITGKGLVHLKDIKTLKSFVLDGTEVNDKSLSVFENFKHHKDLIIVLEHTSITDKGIKSLSGLHIGALYLERTTITDRSVEYLKEMQALKMLDIQFTDITETGYSAIYEHLPNCKVVYKEKKKKWKDPNS